MRYLFPLIGLGFISLSSSLLAEGFESHDAHVHGTAKLQIVAEKNSLVMHFESPAMNIVGFEHDVENQQQEVKIKNALEMLAKVEGLFKFSGGECNFIESDIGNPFDNGESNHESEHKHHESEHKHHESEHKHHESEHKHHESEHKHHESEHEHHESEHEHHESEHGHHEAEQGRHESVHREFELEYKAVCKDISELSRIDLPLMSTFEGIETLDVQYVIQGQQGSVSVSRPDLHIELAK